MPALVPLRLTAGAVVPLIAAPGTAAVLGLDLNNKIDLGQLIIALTTVVGVIVYLVSMKSDLKNLTKFIHDKHTETGERIEKVEGQIEKLAEVLVNVARQEERMDAQQRRQDSSDRRIEQLTDELSRLRTFGVNGNPNERMVGTITPKTY